VANKGTLFLDEVGELPLATQARLLRVLETGEYIPVGATEVRKTDVRIVAATNVNIRQAISEGRFREDLYYRLNSIPIQMPPLRERGEDIILLFRLFALQMAEKYKMDRVVLDEGAKQLLMHYKWPGNVRQLKNITEQISVLSPERTITAQALSQFIPHDQESTQLATIHREGSSERVFADSNSRYLSSSEVAALSDAERCIAWNEIIASSNGYAFKNSGLAHYFAGCSWYYRNPGASSGGNLNDAGRSNVELLQSYTDSWWKNLVAY
jgi:transcriptional regulator with PAS, ATPase and Fis domain